MADWKQYALEFAAVKLGTLVSIFAIVGMTAMVGVWHTDIKPVYCEGSSEMERCERGRQLFEDLLFASPWIIIAFVAVLNVKFLLFLKKDGWLRRRDRSA